MTSRSARLVPAAAAAAVALIGVTGCAARQAAASTDKPAAQQVAWPAAINAGSLHQARDYPALGVSLAPVSAAAATTAKISPDNAYAECKTVLACPATKHGPTIVLAHVTTRNGGTVTANSSTPASRSATAYVLRWDSVPCRATGGVPGSVAKSTTCVWIALVDATTGQAMGSGQTNTPGG